MKRILSVVVLGVLMAPGAWGQGSASADTLSPKCAYLPGIYPWGEVNHAFAQCWQEIDDMPGCHVYRAHYHNGESVRAGGSGECRGGLFGGMLTIASDEGVFEGPVVDGKLNGHWVEGFADGGVHEGPYVDGKRNGHWVERFADGGVHEGPYVDDKRNGHWVERSADGIVGEGPYVDDVRNGDWIFRYGGRVLMRGPYVDGKMNGLWTIRLHDGLVIHVTYDDGKPDERMTRLLSTLRIVTEVFSSPRRDDSARGSRERRDRCSREVLRCGGFLHRKKCSRIPVWVFDDSCKP